MIFLIYPSILTRLAPKIWTPTPEWIWTFVPTLQTSFGIFFSFGFSIYYICMILELELPYILLFMNAIEISSIFHESLYLVLVPPHHNVRISRCLWESREEVSKLYGDNFRNRPKKRWHNESEDMMNLLIGSKSLHTIVVPLTFWIS